MTSVSRETLAALVERYGLPATAGEALAAIVAALAEEPDPPTTLRTPRQAVEGHVADSLSGLGLPELVEATRIADVGAGAGFPGLALAAALPDARVDLIEAATRKAAVSERLAAAGGLGNVSVVVARAEEWAAGLGRGRYAAVTARAVGPLAVLAEYAAPLLEEGGALVAWKAARDAEEEGAAAAAAATLGLRPDRVVRVQPFAAARERHLHVYSKLGPTPPRFPRRVGVARKRPLA